MSQTIHQDVPRKIVSSGVNEQEFSEFARRADSEGMSISDALAALSKAYARRKLNIPDEFRIRRG